MPFMRHALTTLTLGALSMASAGPASAQPRIANGQVTSQAAGSPLAAGFHALVSSRSDVTWIGYSVPVVPGDRRMCCGGSGSGNTGDSRCGLEPSGIANAAGQAVTGTPSGPVKLEGADHLVVLFRITQRTVERIRVFSEDCELDAGGRPVVWLDGVRPSDSIALLEGYAIAAPAGSRDNLANGAIAAIALHGDPAADPALERLVAPAQPEAMRRKVTFWLGNARAARGLATLQRVLRDDPSIEVRKSAVFGVSQSREAGAADLLVSVARTDKEPRLRQEGIFWLAQGNTPRASVVILEALDKDPAPEVRKKAVFALSQLKDSAGVNALVGVARSHADPAVRGEAIFWLGQKAGARAAEAITERIENDADTEVKKRAVFALSQLPKDEGVPLLINVARTNANAAVRKQAMFWLGQSKDPRALTFFEDVLTRRQTPH